MIIQSDMTFEEIIRVIGDIPVKKPCYHYVQIARFFINVRRIYIAVGKNRHVCM